MGDLRESEIEVEHGGQSLTDDASTVEFSEIITAGPGTTTETLTIRNTGARSLTNLAATIDGANAADFSAGTLNQTTLAPGESVTLVLTFDPAEVGAKTSTLQIASNDPDENPFDIDLTGELVQSAPFDEWLWDWGLTGDDAQLTADGDKDQVSLLEEYGYNLAPNTFDQHTLTPGTGESGLPLLRLVGDRLRVEYIRRHNDPSLVYTVEFGGALPNGFSAATETETVIPIDDEFERVIVDDSETTATQSARFGRVVLQPSTP